MGTRLVNALGTPAISSPARCLAHCFAAASLADGYMEGELIECPLHGGCFDIKTGKAMTPPVTDDIKTYEVKIDGDDVLVGVPGD